MSALAVGEGAPSPLDPYRDVVTASEGVDEVVTLDGVRESAEHLADHIAGEGLPGLLAARAEARRFVADEGITYGAGIPADEGDEPAGSAVPTEPRTWELDPVPLSLGSGEWAQLARGVQQRARLLDAVLTDLTGEQRLIRDGILPGAAVHGHDDWLPQAEGIRLPGPRQLVMPAFDLARDHAGTWRVFADRTQAPQGAGYAMANRRIIARVLPELHREVDLAHLRGFFDKVQRCLTAVAPQTDDVPRAVILTPGALSPAAFDEAFQSTLLGIPVVEVEDLVSRDGRIWMRTTSGLAPVDVIMRRVDGRDTDQLDLRSDSRFGLPGLVEAARLGNVSVVNPVTSGVLENPALIPYLPRVCRHLLDEDLITPSTVTWWAGEPSHLSHIITHLSSLVVKPTSRVGTTRNFFGWELTAQERDQLAMRIQAEPWRWTAQDPLTMSTAPVVTAGGLDPRHVVLRTFAVADEDDYAVLPGGLGRVAVRPDSGTISNITGAMSKDVWVHVDAETMGEGVGPALPHRVAVGTPAPFAAPAPRVAADLYWMGRYAERAEAAARLLRVTDNLVDDHGARPGTTGHTAMLALLGAVTEVMTVRPGFLGEDGHERLANPLPHLRDLTLDPRIIGSVAYSVHRAVIAAQAVRETLSGDTWLVMSRLERTLQHAVPDDDLQELLMETIEGLLALAGIGVESFVRDPAWAFADAGKRVERAQQTIRLLRSLPAVERAPVVEGTTTESMLVATESVITYRRRLSAAAGGPALEVALDLALRDETNPRSVAFQLSRLAADLELIGDETALARTREVGHRIADYDLDELFADERKGLARELGDLAASMREIHRAVDSAHFVRKAPGRSVQWVHWNGAEARS